MSQIGSGQARRAIPSRGDRACRTRLLVVKTVAGRVRRGLKILAVFLHRDGMRLSSVTMMQRVDRT